MKLKFLLAASAFFFSIVCTAQPKKVVKNINKVASKKKAINENGILPISQKTTSTSLTASSAIKNNAVQVEYSTSSYYLVKSKND